MTITEEQFRGPTETLNSGGTVFIQDITRFVVANTSAVTIRLPNATYLQEGHRVHVVGNGVAVTVRDFIGTLLATVPSGSSQRFTCVNTDAANGTWKSAPSATFPRVRTYSSPRTTRPNQFDDDWTDTTNCDPVYRLRACEVVGDDPNVIFTDEDLCAYVNGVVTLAEYDSCYIVFIYNGRDQTTESVTVTASLPDCGACFQCDTCDDSPQEPPTEICPPNAPGSTPDPCVGVSPDFTVDGDHPCITALSMNGVSYEGVWYTIADFYTHPDYVDGPCWCYQSWTWGGSCGETAAEGKCYYWYIVNDGTGDKCKLLTGRTETSAVNGCDSGDPFCGA